MKLSTYTKLVDLAGNSNKNSSTFSERGAVAIYSNLSLLRFLNKLGAPTGVILPNTAGSRPAAEPLVQTGRVTYLNTAHWFLSTHATLRIIGNRPRTINDRFRRYTVANFFRFQGSAPELIAVSTRTWFSTFRRMYKKLRLSISYPQVGDLRKYLRKKVSRWQYVGPSKRYRYTHRGLKHAGVFVFKTGKRIKRMQEHIGQRVSWPARVSGWSGVRQYYLSKAIKSTWRKLKNWRLFGPPWLKWNMPRCLATQIPFRARRFKRTWIKTFKHKRLKSQKKDWTFFKAGTWERRMRWSSHNLGLGFEGSVAYTLYPGLTSYRKYFRRGVPKALREKIYSARRDLRIRGGFMKVLRALKLSRISRFSKKYGPVFKKYARYARRSLVLHAMSKIKPSAKISFAPALRHYYFALPTRVGYRQNTLRWFSKKRFNKVTRHIDMESVATFFDTKRADLQKVFPKFGKPKRWHFSYRNTSMTVLEKVAAAFVLRHKTRWTLRSKNGVPLFKSSRSFLRRFWRHTSGGSFWGNPTTPRTWFIRRAHAPDYVPTAYTLPAAVAAEAEKQVPRHQRYQLKGWKWWTRSRILYKLTRRRWPVGVWGGLAYRSGRPCNTISTSVFKVLPNIKTFKDQYRAFWTNDARFIAYQLGPIPEGSVDVGSRLCPYKKRRLSRKKRRSLKKIFKRMLVKLFNPKQLTGQFIKTKFLLPNMKFKKKSKVDLSIPVPDPAVFKKTPAEPRGDGFGRWARRTRLVDEGRMNARMRERVAYVYDFVEAAKELSILAASGMGKSERFHYLQRKYHLGDRVLVPGSAKGPNKLRAVVFRSSYKPKAAVDGADRPKWLKQGATKNSPAQASNSNAKQQVTSKPAATKNSPAQASNSNAKQQAAFKSAANKNSSAQSSAKQQVTSKPAATKNSPAQASNSNAKQQAAFKPAANKNSSAQSSAKQQVAAKPAASKATSAKVQSTGTKTQATVKSGTKAVKQQVAAKPAASKATSAKVQSTGTKTQATVKSGTKAVKQRVAVKPVVSRAMTISPSYARLLDARLAYARSLDSVKRKRLAARTASRALSAEIPTTLYTSNRGSRTKTPLRNWKTKGSQPLSQKFDYHHPGFLTDAEVFFARQFDLKNPAILLKLSHTYTFNRKFVASLLKKSAPNVRYEFPRPEKLAENRQLPVIPNSPSRRLFLIREFFEMNGLTLPKQYGYENPANKKITEPKTDYKNLPPGGKPRIVRKREYGSISNRQPAVLVSPKKVFKPSKVSTQNTKK